MSHITHNIRHIAHNIKQKMLNVECYVLHGSRGFVLVEVLIACAIISTITFAIFSGAQKGIGLSNLALHQIQASFLLEEGAESVRAIRDTSWATISNLTLGTTYYLSYDTNLNLWSLTTTPNVVDSFTRTVVLEAVNRDSTDDISVSGTNDPRTKKVTVTVSWLEGGKSTSKILSFYLADIFS